MTSERTSHQLADVIDLIGGGTPKTGVSEYWGGSIPWLSVKDFSNDDRYVYATEKSITQAGLDNSSTKLLTHDDIIISARGTVGELAMIPFPMAFNQSCYGIRGRKDVIIQPYLFYLLKDSIRMLKSQTHGSVFDTITRDTFTNITVSLPSKSEQQTIADILTAIDDKISLNWATNRHLEQIAQAIFKSWFVDFEPWSGVMPNGWYPCTIGSLSTEINARLNEECEFEVLSAVKTGELVPSNDYFTKQVYSKELTRYKTVEPNDFAYNPMRINIGSIGANERGKTCCVSPDYIVFRAKDGFHYFLRFIIKSPSFQESVGALVSGSVRQRVYYKQLKTIEAICPDSDTLAEFNVVYDALVSKMNELKQENANLADLRDTLLPQLVSGELSVANLTNAI